MANLEPAQLAQISRSIQKLFEQRQRFVQREKAGLVDQISEKGEGNEQSKDFRVWRYAEIVSEIKSNEEKNITQRQDTSCELFWKQNQDKQKLIERKLRQLKQNDQLIKGICSKQQQIWNHLEQLEQNSPQIQEDQGSRQIVQDLKLLEKQKQQRRQTKLLALSALLQELAQLKQLRQNRISKLAQQKITSLPITGLTDLIYDLKQVVQQREIIERSPSEDEILKAIQTVDSKVKEVQQQLLHLYQLSLKQFGQLHHLRACKQKYLNSQQNLLQVLQIQPVNLSNFLGQCANFINRHQAIKQENEQLKQGVTITVQTMRIFERVRLQIETESKRRPLFVNLLQSLQAKCADQVAKEAEMKEIQAQLQALSLNQSKLQSKLQNNSKQLTQSVQKLLKQQLQEYQTDINAKTAVYQKLKLSLNNFLKEIHNQLQKANTKFGGIINDTMPGLHLADTFDKSGPQIRQLLLRITKASKRLNLGK